MERHSTHHSHYDDLAAHCAEQDRDAREGLFDQMQKHLEEVGNCTLHVRGEKDIKEARVWAELSRSHATSAMALAISIAGTPECILAVEGTGQ